jgi:glutathione S-transferase
MSASHYVEKVRFCMDYAGIEYEEEQDCGVLGSILFSRSVPVLNVPGRAVSIGNSSDILRYLYSLNFNNEKVRNFLQPTEEALRLEDMFDSYGKATMRYVKLCIVIILIYKLYGHNNIPVSKLIIIREPI